MITSWTQQDSVVDLTPTVNDCLRDAAVINAGTMTSGPPQWFSSSGSPLDFVHPPP